jgi:hypothetical protein
MSGWDGMPHPNLIFLGGASFKNRKISCGVLETKFISPPFLHGAFGAKKKKVVSGGFR